jgi:membrane protease YdiL (CAAX protease family)
MNESRKTFRDELLSMEKPNDAYKKKYEKEIQAMSEKKLSTFGRIGVGLLVAFGLLVIFVFADMLQWALPSEGISNTVTYGFVLSGLSLAIVFTLLAGYLVICGRFGLIIKPSLVVGIGTVMSFLLVVAYTFFMEITLLQINPQDWRVKLQEQLAAAAFFMFVFAGLYLIIRVLYRLESKTHEKLLEIEYRLIDLSEKIENKTSE